MNKTEKLKLLTQIVEITEKTKITEKDLDFLPENYKLMHIAKNTECGDYKHYSLAIFNEEDKEIIIANYGTHVSITKPLTTMHDIYADIQLGLKLIPSKFSSTSKFIEQIKDLLGSEYNDYTITCTGHSLGGFLAQLAGTKCKAIGFKDVKVVTFDAPGAKEVVVKLANSLDYNGDLEQGIENYITRPNFVNSTNTHLGEVFYTPPLENESSNNEKFSILKSFSKITGISKLVEKVSDHMIWKFTEFFEKGKAIPLKVDNQWNNSTMIIENTEKLDQLAKNTHNLNHFDRKSNATNPEYLYCYENEYGFSDCCLYDHDDVITYYKLGNLVDSGFEI